MKRILVVMMAALLLAGCAQQADDKKEPASVDQLLHSGTVSGGTWEIRYKKDVADGVTTEVVNYTLTEAATGKKVGIAVNKAGTSETNSVYKFGIMAGRKTEPFTNGFWDGYTISLGQEYMLLDNAVSGPAETGGEYRFTVVGGMSPADLQRLKSATLITVELISSSNPERKTTIPVAPQFQQALLAKIP